MTDNLGAPIIGHADTGQDNTVVRVRLAVPEGVLIAQVLRVRGSNYDSQGGYNPKNPTSPLIWTIQSARLTLGHAVIRELNEFEMANIEIFDQNFAAAVEMAMLQAENSPASLVNPPPGSPS